MSGKLEEKVLNQIKAIKRDLTMVELAIEESNFSLEEKGDIIWNNISGITSNILSLINRLSEFTKIQS